MNVTLNKCEEARLSSKHCSALVKLGRGCFDASEVLTKKYNPRKLRARPFWGECEKSFFLFVARALAWVHSALGLKPTSKAPRKPAAGTTACDRGEFPGRIQTVRFDPDRRCWGGSPGRLLS